MHLHNTLTHLYSHMHTLTLVYLHARAHWHTCSHVHTIYMYTHEHFHTCIHIHEHIAHTLACLHTCNHMYILHPHPCSHTHKHLHVCTLVRICTHLHMHRYTCTHVMTLIRTHKNSGSHVLWSHQLCPPSPIQAILFSSLDFEFQLPPPPSLFPLSGQLVVRPQGPVPTGFHSAMPSLSDGYL